MHYLARNALFHGLRSLGVGEGDIALMPSYHHGVEVETVRHTGARVIFYRVDKSLSADFDDVARRAHGARLLYLIHYLGVPQHVQAARDLAAQFGLLLVEDCALALLSRHATGAPIGGSADLAARINRAKDVLLGT